MDGPGSAAADGPRAERSAPTPAGFGEGALWMRRLLAEHLSAVPLRQRLIAILVVALLIALMITGYGIQLILRSYMLGQLDTQLRRVAETASRDATFAGQLFGGREDRRSPPIPSEFVIQLALDDPFAALYRSGGYPDESSLPRFPRLSSAQAHDTEREPCSIVTSDGGSWRVVSFAAPGTVSVDGGPAVPGAITIGVSIDRVDDAVGQLRVLTLLIGGAAILACSTLGWMAIRRSFQPLIEVEQTAAAIAAGDLSRRIPFRPPSTEVGRLTQSLNGMLAQIESAFREREASEARTRRFAADASHELRTPLVSIRGFAELYRQGAVPSEDVPRTMRRIEDEAKRMGNLVEDLLLLARLDAQRPGRTDPVDLMVLAGDAVHDARGLDATRDVRLEGIAGDPSPSGPCVVTGDEDRLRQVVANLVGNAVRHTFAGSPIEIGVGAQIEPGGSTSVVFEVRDHGPGLTPEQAKLAFQRFSRVDSSRHRGKGGGSGLGLSIVSAVVAGHGGSVQVLPTPGGGATFQVRLPASRHEAPPGP